MLAKLFDKLKRKIYLKKLYRTDKSLWRVEMARKMGVKVGSNCRFFSYSFFSEPYLVEIGNNVIISGRVVFLTHDGSVYLFRKRDEVGGLFGRITVGDNCFIGMGAIIQRNVKIGNNCVVGAGAVVRKDVPDNSVVMGNPAEVVFKTSMLEKLLLNDKNLFIDPFFNERHKKELLSKHFNVD